VPSADYYRRQADVCVRLSVAHSDEAISRRLIILAKAYIAIADDIAGNAQAAACRAAGSAGLAQIGGANLAPPSFVAIDLLSAYVCSNTFTGSSSFMVAR
jgi:hypothetical protein